MHSPPDEKKVHLRHARFLEEAFLDVYMKHAPEEGEARFKRRKVVRPRSKPGTSTRVERRAHELHRALKRDKQRTRDVFKKFWRDIGDERQ